MKKIHFVFAAPFLTLAVVYGLSACSATTALDSLVAALPSVAISSPTAGTSSTYFVTRTAGLTEHEVEGPKLDDAIGELKTLSKKTPAEAAAGIRLKIKGRTNTCFGQGKPYVNHPDGGPDGSTLSNDTGFDSETETIDGNTVACPAATMNSKIGQLAGLVNEAMKLNFVSAAALSAAGKVLPTTEGGTATASLTGVDGLGEASVTVTKQATLTGGYETFRWVVSGEFTDGSRTGAVNFDLTHSRVDDTNFKGRFTGYMPRGSEWYAFSLTYNVSGGVANYEIKSLSTRSVGGSTVPTDLFKGDGTVDFSPATDRQDMVYGVASMQTATGLGSAIFAWNAGKNDPRSRIFQASTAAGTGGADTGYAYFGFGSPVSEANLTGGTLLTVSSMICAWTAGDKAFLHPDGTAEHTLKAQAMQMLRNTTTGQFEPVLGGVKIAYCPTNSCDGAGGGFTYGGAACSAANSLGTTTEYGTVTVTTPTYP